MKLLRPRNPDVLTDSESQEYEHHARLTLGGAALTLAGCVSFAVGVATGSTELICGGTAGIVGGGWFTKYEHEQLVEIEFKAILPTVPLENMDVI